MQCGTGLCGHCQLGPYILCRAGPGRRLTRLPAGSWPRRSCDRPRSAPARLGRPSVAVWEVRVLRHGCQLSLLDLEDELLASVAAVDIRYFLEMTRAVVEGPTTSPSWKARSRQPH